MISQKDLHIVCASGTHSILKTLFLKPNYYIYFNPWFNHILLYVVDLTNRQCTLALRYFRSCFRCVSDIQSSLVLWLQPSLPITKFISISWKMTPHLTCSSNQELGVIYILSNTKYMVLICLSYEQFISTYPPTIIVVLSYQLNVQPISHKQMNLSSLVSFWTPSKTYLG